MNEIILRPAHPDDKTAVSALSAKIWDGDDYLAERFDDWLADEHGRFTVAYSGPHLVGCGKLTRFSPGEWWLEGLRVDPDWRGQGIASLLHHNVIQLAVEQKLTGHLRLATAGHNFAVHKMSLDTGFQHISQHLSYKASVPADSSGPTPFTAVETAEKARVESWFKLSAHFTTAHGLLEDSWKWYEITPRLDQLLENGRIYWWHKSDDPTQLAAGLIILHHRDPQTVILNYLDSPTGQWARLFDDVRHLSQSYHVNQLLSKPLATDQIKSALPQAGWEVAHDLEMWVFERPLG